MHEKIARYILRGGGLETLILAAGLRATAKAVDDPPEPTAGATVPGPTDAAAPTARCRFPRKRCSWVLARLSRCGAARACLVV